MVEKGLGIFENNDVYCNQSIGVYVVTGAVPTIRNNSVRDGEGDGIAGTCTLSMNVSNRTCAHMRRFTPSCGCSIKKNSVSYGEEDGIAATYISAHILEACV